MKERIGFIGVGLMGQRRAGTRWLAPVRQARRANHWAAIGAFLPCVDAAVYDGYAQRSPYGRA